ncbi:undecaprenyl-diphosphatase [Paenibacillus rigui]|uniref:undecaprenyl-diphosphatase n=1 Tax=Paenibacillus rigui TaxID=554312 RepID=UPI0015C6266A|nr:undecaprenyl-diphosphatase [Paenibacillus rigui]
MNYDVFQWINNLADHYDWIDDIMEFGAQGIVWVMIVLLAVVWFTGRERNQRLVFFACVSTALALLVAGWAISPVIAHPRPFMEHNVHQLIPHAADPSFPSDHATFAFSLAFTVWFANKRLGRLLIVLAVITGVSRIYVGVHYPADILGGAAVAFVSSLLVRKLTPWIEPAWAISLKLYRKLTSHVPFLSGRS